MAINPKDARNIVVGIHDDPFGASPSYAPGMLGPGYWRLSAFVTKDGGDTWEKRTIPIITDAPPGSRWGLFCNMGDPVVLFAPDGTAHFFGLATTCADGDLNAATSYLFVTTSTDGGTSWGEPTLIWQGPGAAHFQDKPWAAIDAKTGQLAVAWTAAPHFNRALLLALNLMVSVSRDSGESWSPPIVAARTGPLPQTGVWEDYAMLHFAVPAWGKDGALHVGYRSCFGNFTSNCIRVATSRDGGLTWASVEAASIAPAKREDARATGDAYPVLDVDASGGPRDGRVYLSYHSAPSGDYDLFLTWSDDQGKTWAPPISLNDNPEKDGTDQFHHWMDVDETGAIHALFFDRRNDDANRRIQATYAKYDPATGALKNAILTQPWDPDPNASGAAWFGHYEGISAAGGTVAAAWTKAAQTKAHQEPYSNAQHAEMDVHVAVFGVHDVW